MNSSKQDTAGREDEIDLIAFLRVAWDYRYAIILITALFVIMAVVLALVATPKYRAEVVVVKASEQSPGGMSALASQFGGLASLAGLSAGPGNPGREAQAVLESRNLVEEFIKRNNLTEHLLAKTDEPPSLWRAVKDFREDVLTIRTDDLDGITTVAVVWRDPETAAQWANDFVALANELIRTRALREASRNIEYLSGQLEQTNVVDLQQVLYNLIENETKTAMLASGRIEYAFTVVDPAVPPELRVSPKRKLIVAAGGFLGLFCGIVLVYVYHIFRRITAAE